MNQKAPVQNYTCPFIKRHLLCKPVEIQFPRAQDALVLITHEL